MCRMSSVPSTDQDLNQSSTFFTDLSDVLDRRATFVDPLVVVGDLNVPFD